MGLSAKASEQINYFDPGMQMVADGEKLFYGSAIKGALFFLREAF